MLEQEDYQEQAMLEQHVEVEVEELVKKKRLIKLVEKVVKKIVLENFIIKKMIIVILHLLNYF